MLLKRLRVIFVGLLFVVFCGICKGEPVGVDCARVVATNFLKAKSQGNIVLSEIKVTDFSENVPFYIFSGSKHGFIIISRDDGIFPILGYSSQSTFDKETIPPGLRYWMETINEDITEYLKTEIRGNNEAKKEWNKLQSSSTSNKYTASALIETAVWGQGSPYNDKCPALRGGHCAVGCVATAMAIIAKHFEYPQCGSGILPSYSYRTDDGKRKNISGYELGYDYLWSYMKNDYSDGEYSEVEAESVATLMHDCGVMVKMQYDESSGAYVKDVAPALQTYLGYSPDMKTCNRDDFSDESWVEIIKENIDGGMPVLYTGISSSNEGHAFVVDGYDENDYLHINWGWDGASNGYFKCPKLGSFTRNQVAIVNIHPKEEAKSQIMLTSSGQVKGMASSIESFFDEEPFTLAFAIRSVGKNPVSGQISAAVVTRDEEIKFFISDSIQLNDFYSSSAVVKYLNCRILNAIYPGDRLKLFFKMENDEIWRVLPSEKIDGIVSSIPLEDEFSIAESARVAIDIERAEIKIFTKADVDYCLQESSGKQVISGKTGKDGVIILDKNKIPQGKYELNLKLRADEKVYKLIF